MPLIKLADTRQIQDKTRPDCLDRDNYDEDGNDYDNDDDNFNDIDEESIQTNKLWMKVNKFSSPPIKEGFVTTA